MDDTPAPPPQNATYEHCKARACDMGSWLTLSVPEALTQVLHPHVLGLSFHSGVSFLERTSFVVFYEGNQRRTTQVGFPLFSDAPMRRFLPASAFVFFLFIFRLGSLDPSEGLGLGILIGFLVGFLSVSEPANKEQSGHFTALRGKEELNRTLRLVTFFRVRAMQKAFMFSGSGGGKPHSSKGGSTTHFVSWFPNFAPGLAVNSRSTAIQKANRPFGPSLRHPKKIRSPTPCVSAARMSLAGSYTWRSSAVQLLDQLAANARRVEQIGRRVL